MIVRNRKINPNSKEISLTVSYTSADVRRFLEIIANILCSYVGDEEKKKEAIEKSRMLYNSPGNRYTEDSLRYPFEHMPSMFKIYEAPYRQQLSAWACVQAISLGYLTPSATNPDEYLLTDKFFALVK